MVLELSVVTVLLSLRDIVREDNSKTEQIGQELICNSGNWKRITKQRAHG